MKRFIFLTALCIPHCAIHTMNKPEYITPQSIVVHAKPVQTLSIETHCMLSHFNTNKKDTRKELVEIIDRMNSLKSAQPPIQEKEIGFYWYKQSNNDWLADSFKNTLFGSAPIALTKSIFFARLAQYNKDLKQKCLISPNNQQVKDYFKKIALDDLVLKNAQHRIIIPQQTIDESTIPTPTSVALEEFATFLNDIQALLNTYSLEEICQTAKLVYHDELIGRSSQP